MEPSQLHERLRSKIRRRPAWLLRRREAQIITSIYPSNDELAELGIIRKELRIRATRPAILRRWPR